MITKPPIDKLTEIASNKYVLCCATSKRAKLINDSMVKQGGYLSGNAVQGKTNSELTAKENVMTNAKAISTAAAELEVGKTLIVKED